MGIHFHKNERHERCCKWLSPKFVKNHSNDKTSMDDRLQTCIESHGFLCCKLQVAEQEIAPPAPMSSDSMKRIDNRLGVDDER